MEAKKAAHQNKPKNKVSRKLKYEERMVLDGGEGKQNVLDMLILLSENEE